MDEATVARAREVIRTSAIATARKVLSANRDFVVLDDATVRDIGGALYVQVWVKFTKGSETAQTIDSETQRIRDKFAAEPPVGYRVRDMWLSRTDAEVKEAIEAYREFRRRSPADVNGRLDAEITDAYSAYMAANIKALRPSMAYDEFAVAMFDFMLREMRRTNR